MIRSQIRLSNEQNLKVKDDIILSKMIMYRPAYRDVQEDGFKRRQQFNQSKVHLSLLCAPLRKAYTV